jgi:hypothetical protein
MSAAGWYAGGTTNHRRRDDAMPPFHVPLLTIDFGSAQATAIGLPAIVALVVIAAVVGTAFVLS